MILYGVCNYLIMLIPVPLSLKYEMLIASKNGNLTYFIRNFVKICEDF